jgi:D-Ala-teichoic acid biosynthesis protein
MPYQFFHNITNSSYGFVVHVAGNRWVRFVSLTVYYVGILVGLILLYGRGDFSTPPFVYQGF